MLLLDLRESKVSNDGRLVKRESRRPDGEKSPAEGEQPDLLIFQHIKDFSKPEIGFSSSRRVSRKSCLDKSFLILGKPACS